VTSVEVSDNIVLTDLARERMFKYGMVPKRVEIRTHPEDDSQEVLIHRIKQRCLARLNGQVDPALLDTVIRRVLRDMK